MFRLSFNLIQERDEVIRTILMNSLPCFQLVVKIVNVDKYDCELLKNESNYDINLENRGRKY